MKFWFYCYDYTPEKHPEELVMFSVSPDEQYKEIREQNLNREDHLKAIVTASNAARDEFIKHLSDINIQLVAEVFREDGEEYEFPFNIVAKDIPKAKEYLTSLGWQNSYIPFGP